MVGRAGGEQGIRMVTVSCEEGRHADSGVERVVVGELGEGEEVEPICLSEIAETSHEVLDGLVCSLRLSVRLRVESRGQGGLGAQDAGDFAPPCRRKGGSSVADDVRRQAMLTVDVLDELSSQDACAVGRLGGDEVSEFGETVDDDEYGVVSGRRGKFGDVVPRD